ncbi:MAG: collagen-like protein [Flavobacteriaceae bacterium]|nr:collagen-like protein [Flavobacteriaceae bacterium]
MKKLITLLTISSILFISCQGEMGPPGRDGQDGVNILGQVFETVVSFDTSNDFEVLVEIPNQIEVFDSDVLLGYILVGVDNGVDIWEPLPQTLFLGSDSLIYGFNYTFADVVFFMDATFPLEELDSDFTQDIVFRVAVIPADIAKDINVNKIENVMNFVNIEEIIRLD